MRRRIALLLAAALAMGVASATPAVADSHEGGTYLALGDSVAAGTQQPQPFTDNGYPNKLYKELRDDYGFDSFVNLACPGDDSAEMIDGDGGIDGSNCYFTGSPFGPSQLAAAVGYMTFNPGEVKFITLTIGANDVLPCGSDLGCTAAALAGIDANLNVIIPALRAAAGPDVPIVAMNYYSPNLAFWLIQPEPAQGPFMEGLLALTAFANDSLEATYAGLEVPVADVEMAFRTHKTWGRVPTNIRAVCQLTLMCEKSGRDWVLSDYDPGTPGPQTDIHPSNLGHRKIAAAFSNVLEMYDLLGG